MHVSNHLFLLNYITVSPIVHLSQLKIQSQGKTNFFTANVLPECSNTQVNTRSKKSNAFYHRNAHLYIVVPGIGLPLFPVFFALSFVLLLAKIILKISS